MLSLIVAMDHNRLIGRDNDLPWRLPDDLRQFKRLTVGKTILMGRKTWESLRRPLPDRENWVLSRDPSFTATGARVFTSLNDALAAHTDGELMVIGGAQLYGQALPLAQRLYLTEVDARIDGGDAWFPAIDPAQWREISAEAHPADDRHPYPFRFRLLVRVAG